MFIMFFIIVLVGTIFPLLTESVTKQRISVQAPYFNRFSPLIGLGLIVGVAFGALMRYQTSKIIQFKKVMLISLLLAIPMTFIFAWAGKINLTVTAKAYYIQIVGVYLCSWAAVCLIIDLLRRLKTLKYNLKLLLTRNLAYVGAFVVHIGFLISVLGFLGNYRGIEKTVTLNSGQSTEIYGYEIEFDRMVFKKVENASNYIAPINISRFGKKITSVEAARSKYPTSTESYNEIGVYSTFWHDIYIVLASFDRKMGSHATLEININPTVRIVWLSIIMMCLGGFLCLFDRFRADKSRDVLVGGTNVS